MNPHCKVQSYWRPLGFCIDFTNQVRIAMEKYNPTQLLASNSKAATPYKGGYLKIIKRFKISSNAIIAYFDTKLKTQIVILILF